MRSLAHSSEQLVLFFSGGFGEVGSIVFYLSAWHDSGPLVCAAESGTIQSDGAERTGGARSATRQPGWPRIPETTGFAQWRHAWRRQSRRLQQHRRWRGQCPGGTATEAGAPIHAATPGHSAAGGRAVHRRIHPACANQLCSGAGNRQRFQRPTGPWIDLSRFSGV